MLRILELRFTLYYLRAEMIPSTVEANPYDKRDDFDLDIVNFLLLAGDVPRRTSYGVVSL